MSTPTTAGSAPTTAVPNPEAATVETGHTMSDQAQLLRIATAGSVDDGKSTLIGRLLFDSKGIFEDQLASIEATSAKRGDEYTDLALLTDGLRSEREQGITIDVAYRYFSTPRRKFIIADTPGHVQYTRNMVTGASTADVAIILVDARKGVLEQTRRHAFLSALLGIPRLVVAVNKMDLVDYDEATFEAIRTEFTDFAAKLEVHDVTFVPLSALKGDNVVNRAVDSIDSMPWYTGPALLDHLENVHIASDRNLTDVRFPVQYVIRPQRADGLDHRSFAGTVAGGIIKVDDDVVVMPSGRQSTVKAIWGPGGAELDEAAAPAAVTIALNDEIDIVRGEMIARPGNRPHQGTELEAMVCWFDDATTLQQNKRYVIKHTTRDTKAIVTGMEYRLDVNTLHRDPDSTELDLNEIGRIGLRTQTPLMYDPYRRNRDTGAFIMVDEITGNTVGAGMIIGPATTGSNVVWHAGAVQRGDRGQGRTLWLTGLSGSGKSTIASEVERLLIESGHPAYILDGDNLRHGLNADLGFSAEDRAENIRRTAEVAALFADAGVVVVCSLISPMRADRDAAREVHAKADLPFTEVFVDTPLAECEARDPKGLYAKARSGEIPEFTGVSAPYEPPLTPDLHIRPEDGTAEEVAQRILSSILGI
ncbi:bifunctional enzyme CysN/CysC [Dietzia kunjamensis subsp. schimae]|uniref:Multifunctional fusion protein n=1 Tax=Dietzia kunjamensis subsp. schimae TaxID=498198 RepID=A0ABY1N357_9ACTN|nr:adenylyl-sulfate kinase [Dietzia kunjamensis]MBB1015622.1 adenylyl-sulfate kinase [Dietzia kunjamensis subsp. schimae]SMO81777.1 bifunctional enzyme CysN/CysC [Dietzia kunjamensis subsp. schimae]